MPRKDLHEKPFDEATRTKLDIFEQYLETWLPVFLYSPFSGEIQIWDFFAGQGYDMIGQRGSPVRVMDALKKFEADILKSGKKIKVVFNESHAGKYALLKTVVEKYQMELSQSSQWISIEVCNSEFQKLYQIKFAELQKGNSLIFLDQNGVKEITENIFLQLVSFPRTDFLFFISSSYFGRFADDFKTIHPKLDVDEIRNSKYKKLHLAVLNLYKTYLKEANLSSVFMYPFSLMKATATGYNIYGLIFCAKHILAASKFLNIAWDQNKLNGQANYDIENDKASGQIDMFSGQKSLTKIEKFQSALECEILEAKIKTNLDVFTYTLGEGHIPEHAEPVVKRLKDCGRLDYQGRTGISYNAFKDKKTIEYKLKVS